MVISRSNTSFSLGLCLLASCASLSGQSNQTAESICAANGLSKPLKFYFSQPSKPVTGLPVMQAARIASAVREHADGVANGWPLSLLLVGRADLFYNWFESPKMENKGIGREDTVNLYLTSPKYNSFVWASARWVKTNEGKFVEPVTNEAVYLLEHDSSAHIRKTGSSLANVAGPDSPNFYVSVPKAQAPTLCRAAGMREECNSKLSSEIESDFQRLHDIEEDIKEKGGWDDHLEANYGEEKRRVSKLEFTSKEYWTEARLREKVVRLFDSVDSPLREANGSLMEADAERPYFELEKLAGERKRNEGFIIKDDALFKKLSQSLFWQVYFLTMDSKVDVVTNKDWTTHEVTIDPTRLCKYRRPWSDFYTK